MSGGTNNCAFGLHVSDSVAQGTSSCFDLCFFPVSFDLRRSLGILSSGLPSGGLWMFGSICHSSLTHQGCPCGVSVMISWKCWVSGPDLGGTATLASLCFLPLLHVTGRSFLCPFTDLAITHMPEARAGAWESLGVGLRTGRGVLYLSVPRAWCPKYGGSPRGPL